MPTPNLELLNINDPKKYTKWKKEQGIKNGHLPYALRFFDSTKSLIYIAVNHTNVLGSVTYKLIQKVMNIYRKINNTLVIMEGLLDKNGLSPDMKHFNDELNIKNEINYTYFLCKKFNMPYAGVEAENTIFKQLATKYQVNEIFVWECLRVYPSYQKEFTWRDIIEKYVKPNIADIFSVDVETLDFDSQFEKIFKKKFIFGKTKKDLFFPNPNKKTLTNQIGVTYNIIRSTYNITNLYKHIDKYDNIIYVYGQNHAYCDYNVLLDTYDNVEIMYQ
jgi:hypothetical protein